MKRKSDNREQKSTPWFREPLAMVLAAIITAIATIFAGAQDWDRDGQPFILEITNNTFFDSTTAANSTLTPETPSNTELTLTAIDATLTKIAEFSTPTSTSYLAPTQTAIALTQTAMKQPTDTLVSSPTTTATSTSTTTIPLTPSHTATLTATSTSSWTPTATESATSTPTSTSTATTTPTSRPISTATPVVILLTATDDNALNREQMNQLFGRNNWYCFGDRYADAVESNRYLNNGIGIKQQQQNITIQFPIQKISNDTHQEGIDSGVATGGSYGAVVDFTDNVYLPPAECPEWQLSALEEWVVERRQFGRSSFSTRSALQSQMGINSYNCTTFSFALLASLPDTYTVKYPVMFVSAIPLSRDFGVGETIPATTAELLFWVNGQVPGC